MRSTTDTVRGPAVGAASEGPATAEVAGATDPMGGSAENTPISPERTAPSTRIDSTLTRCRRQSCAARVKPPGARLGPRNCSTHASSSAPVC